MSVTIENGGITVSEVEDDDTWDRYVERSPHVYPFHRNAALEVQADHANAAQVQILSRHTVSADRCRCRLGS